MQKLFLVLALSVSLAIPVYASSLSDVAGQNKSTQATTAVQTQPQTQVQTQPQTQASQSNNTSNSNSGSIQIDKSRSKMVNDLAGAADFSGDSQIAKDVQQSIRPYMMAIMQILSWIIVFALGLSVMFDLLYLVALPLRGVLSGGAGATSATSGTATSGSFGGGSFGGGSFGGGSFGGGMSNPTPVQPAGGRGFCLVSQEAINAATAVDPQTGKTKSSISVYAKTAWLKLVLTPVVLILTVTGSLQQIGFTIASILVNLIKNVI